MQEEKYPICGVCEKGRLLPFTGPNNTVVYFCTHCLRKFSGYSEEPTLNGVPIFADIAHYSEVEEVKEGEKKKESPMIDEYEDLFVKFLPEPLIEEEEVYCPICLTPMESREGSYICLECGYRD